MYRWVDHTSELEMRVQADSPEGVIAEATAALGEVLGEAEGERSTRRLSVTGRDLAGLLAAWLEELVFLSEREQVIPISAQSVAVSAETADGEVDCGAGRPSYLVKAVTYHRLAFERADGGWEATVVLDV